ncbi:MAG: hypothetical protein P8X88_09900 [Gammaproteobacteria bacterium]
MIEHHCIKLLIEKKHKTFYKNTVLTSEEVRMLEQKFDALPAAGGSWKDNAFWIFLIIISIVGIVLLFSSSTSSSDDDCTAIELLSLCTE